MLNIIFTKSLAFSILSPKWISYLIVLYYYMLGKMLLTHLFLIQQRILLMLSWPFKINCAFCKDCWREFPSLLFFLAELTKRLASDI